MTDPVVSVVVPTYQRADRLTRLVHALERQTIDAPFEVIIVDNGSTDDTSRVLESLASSTSLELRCLRIEENAGPAPARNAGWRAARADTVAFTDDDCVPQPGWLRAGLAALEGNGLGVVQGATLPDPAIPLGRWAATQHVEGPTAFFESCNIFFRREALQAVGGFAEGFGYFCEDTALGWSVVLAGWDRSYAGEAVVLHDVLHPGLRWFLRRGLMYGNFAAIVRREPELRKHLLWARFFLGRRTAAFSLAVLGLVLSAVRREALVLCLPYLLGYRRPAALRVAALRDQLELLAFDGAVFVGLAKGSVTHRCLVL
jgi:glycosyltransferase involved in cell wall biosynthesis